MTFDTIGMSMQFSDGITCLVASSTTEPAQATAPINGGTLEWRLWNARALMDLTGGFLCEPAGDATFSGRGSTRTAGGAR